MYTDSSLEEEGGVEEGHKKTPGTGHDVHAKGVPLLVESLVRVRDDERKACGNQAQQLHCQNVWTWRSEKLNESVNKQQFRTYAFYCAEVAGPLIVPVIQERQDECCPSKQRELHDPVEAGTRSSECKWQVAHDLKV